MIRQNKLKDIITWVMLSVIACLSIALIVICALTNSRLSKTERHLLSISADASTEAAVTDEPSKDAAVTIAPMYVLGEKDGRIAVFASDGYTVVDILDTYIYSLPVGDREAIRAGVSVYSVNELVTLIQDYTS